MHITKCRKTFLFVFPFHFVSLRPIHGLASKLQTAGERRCNRAGNLDDELMYREPYGKLPERESLSQYFRESAARRGSFLCET